MNETRDQVAGEPTLRTLTPADVARHAGESDPDYLRRLTGACLPPDIAERWMGLLRPSVQLVPAIGLDPLVARLGGLPRLPYGTQWPVWEAHGPLCFVAELDLAGLAETGLDPDIALPRTGRLLCFFYDNPDDFTSFVSTTDAATLAGARMLYLPDAPEDLAETPAPAGLVVYPQRLLTARQILTQPGWEHPRLEAEFRAPDEGSGNWREHPVMADPFLDAVEALHGEPLHQVGGWADSIQYPVEQEVARSALDLGNDFSDEVRVAEEAQQWLLLLQIDSQDDPMWGDCGRLYWLVRRDHLAAGDLTRASFTWQCS